MNVSQAVARVYAQALVDLADDSGVPLGRIYDDLHALRKTAELDRDFWRFWSSPRLDPVTKKRVLDDLFEGKLERPVLGLLHVLVDKRREPVFDNIVAEFDRYKDEREGRVHVYVTVARPLDDDQREELKGHLESRTKKRIEIHERVDPRVLGGLVIKVGDKIIDGSLKRRLRRLRRAMVAAQG